MNNDHLVEIDESQLRYDGTHADVGKPGYFVAVSWVTPDRRHAYYRFTAGGMKFLREQGCVPMVNRALAEMGVSDA